MTAVLAVGIFVITCTLIATELIVIRSSVPQVRASQGAARMSMLIREGCG
jgi:hypothetical protein